LWLKTHKSVSAAAGEKQTYLLHADWLKLLLITD